MKTVVTSMYVAVLVALLAYPVWLGLRVIFAGFPE